ncbi:MAG: ATP-binding cassette domain-containing protein [Comamonadaceae bacterium]|nr:ATP-binding cassette domain-containing protein [Comamonadaceae bacterium]
MSRDVSFRYGNRAVIHEARTWTIRPGEMIGLVGHSGSGKSTLVNLICRFYDVTEGAIRIDGVDLRRIAGGRLPRATSAWCCRSPSCSSAPSPRTSPTASPTPRREEIIAAARAAHAHEFILRLPHGYDSLVGERGQGLSGGERQRISHRARAADRPAHPDPRRGHLVGGHRDREGNPEGAGQPVCAAAPPLPSPTACPPCGKADRLVAMDRGQVVEVGSHDELMAK